MNLARTILIGSAIVAAASLHAATTYNLDFNSQSNSPGLIYDGSYAISPYSGTIGGTSVQLFCEDFNDNVNWGQQNITAYQTSLTASAATLDGQTRYGIANPTTAGASYPAGTTLYDEMAWLATQMLAVSGSDATYNEAAIQEAIWTLTNDKNVNDGLSPRNKTTTQTGTYGDTGVEQSYLAWIADAQADYAGSVQGYASLVTGNWSIVTAVASAGCTVGSGTAYSKNNGVSACTPGTAGTGTVTQEFLAYSGATPTISQGGSG